jgi:hypothetical protein
VKKPRGPLSFSVCSPPTNFAAPAPIGGARLSFALCTTALTSAHSDRWSQGGQRHTSLGPGSQEHNGPHRKDRFHLAREARRRSRCTRDCRALARLKATTPSPKPLTCFRSLKPSIPATICEVPYLVCRCRPCNSPRPSPLGFRLSVR